jgi:glycosyltransferase involved in cell wall biosynthesis
VPRRWWSRRRRAPQVSVIVATYDWSSVLRHAVASVLAQTFTDFELLVVGDACSDDSAAVVASFRDRRVRWHNLASNFGSQSGPNNAGLELARGRYVAYLGHDDLWLPEHLALLTRRLEATGADFAFTVSSLVLPDDGRWVSGLLDGPFGARDFVVPSSLMHRHEAVARIGPWPDYREIALPPDVEWQQRAVAAGLRFAAVPRLTVVKFPSAVRRDSYLHRSDREQADWSRRLRDEPDLEQHELVELARRAARGELRRVGVPDEVFVPLGYLVHGMRIERGLEPGARAAMTPLPLEVDAAQLCLALAAPPAEPVAAGARFRLAVELTNRSGWTLASSAPNPVHLSYRWLDAAGVQLPGESRRSVLPEPVSPGSTVGCLLEIVAPEHPGSYRLRLLLVQELVRWLDEPVAALPELALEVTPTEQGSPEGTGTPAA